MDSARDLWRFICIGEEKEPVCCAPWSQRSEWTPEHQDWGHGWLESMTYISYTGHHVLHSGSPFLCMRTYLSPCCSPRTKTPSLDILFEEKKEKKKVPKIKLLIFYLAINQVTTMVKFSYSVSGVLAFHLCFFDLSRVLQQYYSIYACDLLSWTTFIKTCLNTISQGLKLTSGLGSEIVNLFSVIVKTRQNVVLLHLILLLSLLRFLFFRHLQCCKILPLISLEDKQLGADLSHVKFGAGLIFCITLLLDYTCLEQRQRTFCPCESGFNWDLWYALGIKIGIIALPGFCFKNSSPNP